MFDKHKEIRVSLWNALFAVLFASGLAAGAGVAETLLTFANSQFYDLGQLGVASWGLVMTLAALVGAGLTNEFNPSKYDKIGRAALGAVVVGISALFMYDPLNSAVNGEPIIGGVVVLFGSVIYFVVSVADAEGSLVN